VFGNIKIKASALRKDSDATFQSNSTFDAISRDTSIKATNVTKKRLAREKCSCAATALVKDIYPQNAPIQIMVFTTRPVIMGTYGIAASTHYLATEAGHHVLKRGGNAVDAGATMHFCLTVLKPWLVGPAGEVPILLYWADEGRVIAVNGQGPAPRAATIDWFRDRGYPLIPEDGFTPAVVPGSFDAWLARGGHGPRHPPGRGGVPRLPRIRGRHSRMRQTLQGGVAHLGPDLPPRRGAA